jgi:hypothetical protein
MSRGAVLLDDLADDAVAVLWVADVALIVRSYARRRASSPRRNSSARSRLDE